VPEPPSAPAKKQSRRPTAPVVLRLFALALGLYVLVLAVLYTQQRALVFNAGHSRRETAQANEARTALPAGADRLALRTKQGDRVAAYYGRALQADGRPDPSYARRPTLLFFYGKGGSLAWERPLLASMRRLDANVLMPDYVGFGLSSGEASEANCYATADVCYRYLRGRRDVNQKRIFVAGYWLRRRRRPHFAHVICASACRGAGLVRGLHQPGRRGAPGISGVSHGFAAGAFALSVRERAEDAARFVPCLAGA